MTNLSEQIKEFVEKYEVDLVEHCIYNDLASGEHAGWITVPPFTVMRRVVIFHSVACGCDALPQEVMVHG